MIQASAFIFNELLLNSSSEESTDDNEDEEVGVEPQHEIRGPQVLRPRITNFVSEIVARYSDNEFREHFRIFRPTFNHILTLIEPQLTPQQGRGRHRVTPKNQLLFTIWYFVTPDSYSSLCSRFNIGKATSLRVVRRVTELLKGLAPTFIRWPVENTLHTIKNSFEQMGFPNTIGCIDGCYIPIPTPTENGLSYICRKKFAALILQGVCDNKMLFTHCYVGEVGSTHDATVLKRSEVFQYLTRLQEEKFPENTHLVGDKAYPCLLKLMVPYKDNGNLNNIERNFNFQLSRVRCTIERAFALLKQRFRCFKYFDIKDIEWACKYIMACCVLHNICILQNDVIAVDQFEDEPDNIQGPTQGVGEVNLQRLGIAKRNMLSQTLL